MDLNYGLKVPILLIIDEGNLLEGMGTILNDGGATTEGQGTHIYRRDIDITLYTEGSCTWNIPDLNNQQTSFEG